MILDVLENAHRYQTLNKGFAKAIEFLLRPDLKKLDLERHEIDGDSVYAIVAKGRGRKKEESLLETHEKFIDIQFVLTGTDNMGWKPKSSCKLPSNEYDQENDVQLFADEPDAFLSTKSGAFAIFFPEDAHMPMISTELLHKVIVKVAVDPI
jgi:YhcH/YjgK/YiaL family protein